MPDEDFEHMPGTTPQMQSLAAQIGLHCVLDALLFELRDSGLLTAHHIDAIFEHAIDSTETMTDGQEPMGEQVRLYIATLRRRG